jgi:thioredoxin-dependent peroxiredoxin
MRSGRCDGLVTAGYNGSLLDWLFPQPLPPGTPAPDFSLPDPDGNTVSLTALRGRNVVLIFYPGDDTSVCTKQLCAFRDRWADAQSRNAVIFGVNPQSRASHVRFIAKYHFPFPLLVDPGQKMGAAYHAKSLIVRRTVYLIGPDGIIRFARRGTPDAAEVLSHAA